MKFTFLSPSDEGNLQNEEFNAALSKVKTAMSKGARLAISPRTDTNGFPYFWVEMLLSHKGEGVKLFASESIVNLLFRYLGTGKIDDFDLDLSKIEEMKKDYEDKNFTFELFKYEVEQGKRINITANNTSRFRSFTSYANGTVVYSFSRSEELDAFLTEHDLI